MRVLFVINSLGAGGTERSTAVLLPHLRERGVDASVVVLVHRDEGDEATVRDLGFEVTVLGAGSNRALVAAVPRLRRIIRARRPDVVHTAIFEADILGRVAALGTGVPVLSSAVNTPYARARQLDPNVRRWKLELTRLVDAATARAACAGMHAVTQGVADAVVETLHVPPGRVHVVERGRDPEAFPLRTAADQAGARVATGLPADAEVVLAVGRQEFQKGHVHLIDALTHLVERRPRALVVIAGREGNASDEVRAAVARSSAPDRILLLGHRRDVRTLLVAADVFAMPSLYEGTAGAAIEALAVGVPVVASDVDGTRGVLVDGVTARLVRLGEPRALAAAVIETLEHTEQTRQQVRRGRLLFEERFTIDRCADRMVELYAQMASSGRR